jgi:hypothetical protein
MLDRVQVWALAGPFKDIQKLLRCLGCVLRFVVLLEGEPSPQSKVLSTLEQVFIKDLSELCSVLFSLLQTSLQVPAAEKHPHSMMLSPPCFTVGMVPGFLPTWNLVFRPERSILISSDQRILFLMV